MPISSIRNPATSSPATTVLTADLRAGARGESVRELQTLLNARGYRLTADGDFGAKTTAAVVAFQKAQGLSGDGIVGAKTWTALRGGTPSRSDSFDSNDPPRTAATAMLRLEIARDSRILEAHRSSNNLPGIEKYEAIVRAQRALLAQREGLTPGALELGEAAPAVHTIDEKSVANAYRSTRNDETAYKAIIDGLVDQPRFSQLKAAKETLFDLNGNTPPPPAGTVIDQPFVRDAFKIRQSGVTLDGYTVNDTIFSTDFPAAFDETVKRINAQLGGGVLPLKPFSALAHRDAFQLIPQDRTLSQNNSQFAGARLQNVTLQNLRVHSSGSLQGVFSSDGAYENLTLRNIVVDTQSAHQIAIMGLLSGTLDMADRNGKPAGATLFPLRLGGGTNIYVVGFSRSSSYQYGEVQGTSGATVLDQRKVKTKPGTYYSNFDMDQFIGLMKSRPASEDYFDSIKRCAALSGQLV